MIRWGAMLPSGQRVEGLSPEVLGLHMCPLVCKAGLPQAAMEGSESLSLKCPEDKRLHR